MEDSPRCAYAVADMLGRLLEGFVCDESSKDFDVQLRCTGHTFSGYDKFHFEKEDFR